MSEYEMDDLLDDDLFEHEPTEEELYEATQLARALDRGTADDAPEDALGVAALLRHAQDGSELGGERAETLFEEVLRDAKPPEVEPKRGLSWLRWLLPTGAFVATAAALLLFLRPAPEVRAARLPEPPTELLMAQLRAAAGASSDGAEAARDDEERAFGDYRSGVYAALEERYRR